MNTSRLRTALSLALIATISGTMPLTATATQPHPPSTKPSVQVGPTAIYRYPTDTPGAGLIDKDGLPRATRLRPCMAPTTCASGPS